MNLINGLLQKKTSKGVLRSRTFVVRQSVWKEVYEISELDPRKKWNYTKKFQVDWSVGYNQQLVFDENEKNLEILEDPGYVELLDELNEYDGYLGEEDVLLDMVPKV